ncbi:hypothetical protein PMG11_01406 [Penicillium brasilianum]|uniref:Uncharacterized protein n=1 Tax=Penicillium brasilianum TaxID=104259 RepID=A0A0F7THY0_PENBI|nr:hypothetical protein PMG11_01406 [Penicillium brasilianum]
MSTPAVQMAWSLSESSQSAFSVFRGVLAAATSDNVQVLAIMACEKFGTTIAMSTQTTTKVLSTIVPSPEPTPISFLKSYVGFFKGDCASQLGTSLAGTRFLGLAAALVTTIGPFNGASALDIMLKHSATDLTLLPTVRHLNDLLVSLEARSYGCGFADSVLGWQILLEREVLPRIASEEARQLLVQESLRVPSSDIIAGIVDAFRQVARMGSSTILGATIKVHEAAAWILAFAQWCLEIPPSVYLEGIPDAVCEQPQSQVKIIVMTKEPNGPFELTIHHKLEDITHLIEPGTQELICGMVTIESYFPWLFRRTGFESVDMLRVKDSLALVRLPILYNFLVLSATQ